jgi:hypothetical protein
VFLKTQLVIFCGPYNAGDVARISSAAGDLYFVVKHHLSPASPTKVQRSWKPQPIPFKFRPAQQLLQGCPNLCGNPIVSVAGLILTWSSIENLMDATNLQLRLKVDNRGVVPKAQELLRMSAGKCPMGTLKQV